MYFKDLKDSPFFGDQVFSYEKDGQVRFYVVHDFEITFASDQFVDFVEHIMGDDHIRIYYRDGTYFDASKREELHFGVYKLVHILNI